MDDEPPSSSATPPVIPGHFGSARPSVTGVPTPKKRGFWGTIALLAATVFQFGSKLLLLMPFLKFLPVFLKTGGTTVSYTHLTLPTIYSV